MADAPHPASLLQVWLSAFCRAEEGEGWVPLGEPRLVAFQPEAVDGCIYVNAATLSFNAPQFEIRWRPDELPLRLEARMGDRPLAPLLVAVGFRPFGCGMRPGDVINFPAGSLRVAFSPTGGLRDEELLDRVAGFICDETQFGAVFETLPEGPPGAFASIGLLESKADYREIARRVIAIVRGTPL